MQDYRAVVPTTGRVFFLAESMGALAAIPLATRGVAAMVAVSPVVDLTAAYQQPRLRSAIDAVYHGPPRGQIVRTVSAPLLVFVSPDDTLVPSAEHALRLTSSAGPVQLVACHGQHGDPSCYQPKQVVDFFDAHN